VLYLVDASVFVFRAYYSVPVSFTDRDGRAINALYGFARFVMELIGRASPAHIAIAFDESLTGSWRNRLYPAYKANRERPPADLERQFILCRQFCRLLGLAEYGSDEYEADDIIGTLAVRVRSEGIPATLVTRDKDLAQLVRLGDEFWDYVTDRRFGYHDIPGRFGVIPERIADYLALTGDAVDNIPGVPGVGKKTAAMLLSHFDSLDDLYDRLDEVPRLRFRNAAWVAGQLHEHRDAAFLARELTSIDCDMPLLATLAELERGTPDLAGLTEFFDQYAFGPLLRGQVRRLAAA
jgi:5'-3' exonuclease